MPARQARAGGRERPESEPSGGLIEEPDPCTGTICDPAAAVSREEAKVAGTGPLAERAGEKLTQDELLLPHMGGVRLGMTLDRQLWKDKNHVTLGELAEWFSRYLCLPRVVGHEVFVGAAQDGTTVLIPMTPLLRPRSTMGPVIDISDCGSEAEGYRRRTVGPVSSSLRSHVNK